MKYNVGILAFALVVAAGCSVVTKEATTSAPKSEPVAKSDADKPSPEAGANDKPSVSVNAGDSSAKPSEKAPTTVSNVSLPTELKHEGFEYDGLANAKPMDMELVTSQGTVISGSQTVTAKGVKDGKATYSIQRTGGLEILGSDEVSVEKDGVFTNSSSVAKLSSHAMELPAHPKPGMTWKFHVSADNPTSAMDMETTCKVIGIQSVTTKAGSYKDALLVQQDSVGTLQKQKVRTVSKSWYVKGIGTVKADLVTYKPDGTSEKLTIQETKHK